MIAKSWVTRTCREAKGSDWDDQKSYWNVQKQNIHTYAPPWAAGRMSNSRCALDTTTAMCAVWSSFGDEPFANR